MTQPCLGLAERFGGCSVPGDLAQQELDLSDVRSVRTAIRSGAFTDQTAGLAPGKLQANLAILTEDYALDFEEFCRLNPWACPLVGKSQAGDPMLAELGDIDIRTDVPSYNVYRHGTLTETVTDISAIWRDDFVVFALGCSFTFEKALQEAGIDMVHIHANKTVPMYRTTIQTNPVGPFGGGMVVSLRYIDKDRVEEAQAITSDYPWAHGAPIHRGDPAEIGIMDVHRPNWGDPPVSTNGVPVFWPCGVTPQNALANAKPPICITHTPGRMLITDIDDTKNAFITN